MFRSVRAIYRQLMVLNAGSQTQTEFTKVASGGAAWSVYRFQYFEAGLKIRV